MDDVESVEEMLHFLTKNHCILRARLLELPSHRFGTLKEILTEMRNDERASAQLCEECSTSSTGIDCPNDDAITELHKIRAEIQLSSTVLQHKLTENLAALRKDQLHLWRHILHLQQEMSDRINGQEEIPQKSRHTELKGPFTELLEESYTVEEGNVVNFTAILATIVYCNGEEWDIVQSANVIDNAGKAFNGQTCAFTAPQHGLYTFSLSNETTGQFVVEVMLNERLWKSVDPTDVNETNFEIQLREGDVVGLKITRGAVEGIHKKIITTFKGSQKETP